MGGLNAVGWAVRAHTEILSQEDSVYPQHARVTNDKPFPAGDHVEILVVDDRLGIGLVKSGDPSPPPALHHSFSAAGTGLSESSIR